MKAERCILVQMPRKSAVRLLVLWLPLLGGSACYAQGRFSQATPISGSQFFAALKAVSLDLRSDPSLTKFIPLAEQLSAGPPPDLIEDRALDGQYSFEVVRIKRATEGKK